MVRLEEVGPDRRDMLSNLMQKYLYEMSRYYDLPMDEDGNYPYKYLPLYFTDETRRAYFFYNETDMIGFALINAHSFTGERIDNCIAEFTIFPAFRGRGYGLEAAAALKEKRSGPWQLKYSTKNAVGARLWQRVKEEYGGTEQKLEGDEIAVSFW